MIFTYYSFQCPLFSIMLMVLHIIMMMMKVVTMILPISWSVVVSNITVCSPLKKILAVNIRNLLLGMRLQCTWLKGIASLQCFGHLIRKVYLLILDAQKHLLYPPNYASIIYQGLPCTPLTVWESWKDRMCLPLKERSCAPIWTNFWCLLYSDQRLLNITYTSLTMVHMLVRCSLTLQSM